MRTGIVMSASPGRVTVLLDDPDVEVKLGRDDLGDELVLERDGAELCCRRDGVERRLLVGAAVKIKASHHDGEKLHFVLVD